MSVTLFRSVLITACVGFLFLFLCATVYINSLSSTAFSEPLNLSPKTIANMPNPIATFDTTEGKFKAEIYLDKLPITASNFIDLAKSGFYNGMNSISLLHCY